jgi:hypothetical protein
MLIIWLSSIVLVLVIALDFFERNYEIGTGADEEGSATDRRAARHRSPAHSRTITSANTLG